jgi:hypothetical protein
MDIVLIHLTFLYMTDEIQSKFGENALWVYEFLR